MPDKQPSLILQPADGAFDLPSVLVSSQTSPILSRWFLAAPAVRRDLFNTSLLQCITKPVRVCGLVIQQSLRAFPCNLNINQRFDRVDLGVLSSRRECRDRNPLRFRHQHELCAFALLGLTNLKPPFFAGEKVPSPIACDQSSNFRRSNVLRSRFHASTIRPCSVQSLCRRQQVGNEGYRSGKSCHRAPVFRTQRTPSRHWRASTLGRPPSGDGSGFSNRSLISFHWESVINGFGAVLDPVVFGRRRCGHMDRVINM